MLKKRTILFSYSIGTALRIAWKLIKGKLRFCHSKIRGSSFVYRQTILKRLSMYHPNDIILELQRDAQNIVDANAV